MELIPRTSRAQSMDVLSSQAGIAGYRAVLEAASRYGRFFPMMMTSAGSSKACKLAVLGVGVAGLQAIATARKLGAMVEAYDVREEVKEQIISLGAKPSSSTSARKARARAVTPSELSEEAKRKQQAALGEKLKKLRRDHLDRQYSGPASRPRSMTEDAVKGMRAGSVIIDMAAAKRRQLPADRGGQNRRQARRDDRGDHELSRARSVGLEPFLRAESGESPRPFFGRRKTGRLVTSILEDDIIAASLVVREGVVKGN